MRGGPGPSRRAPLQFPDVRPFNSQTCTLAIESRQLPIPSLGQTETPVLTCHGTLYEIPRCNGTNTGATKLREVDRKESKTHLASAVAGVSTSETFNKPPSHNKSFSRAFSTDVACKTRGGKVGSPFASHFPLFLRHQPHQPSSLLRRVSN